MTAGERSGRGYGPDDPRHPSPHAAYPAYPARPPQPAAPPPGYPPDYQVADPRGQGYPAQLGSNGDGSQRYGDPSYRDTNEGGRGYGGAGYGETGYRGYAEPTQHGADYHGSRRQDGATYPERRYPTNGYPTNGYPGGGYPTNGYPGGGYPSNGYQAPGRGGNDYRGAGQQDPAYRDAGYPGAGYQDTGYREVAHREAGYPDTGYRQVGYQDTGYRDGGYRDGGYRDAGYATSEMRGVSTRPEAYRPPPRGFPPEGRYQPNGSDADPRRPAAGSAGTGPGRRSRGDTETGARNERRRRLPLWQELPLLLVIAFCLAILIRSFLLQAFYIPSGSMEDTLIAGDRVLVNKVVYNFREPARGEVVVFQGTDAWAPLATDDGDAGMFAKIGRTFGDLVGVSRPGEKDFIKRVIGVPGDVVSCCDVEGRIFVNGRPINESYVIRDSPLADSPDGVRDCRGRQFDEVVVEPGQLFVLGDHRQRSQDSRCQGQVPIDNVIGRAFIIVWPNDRWAGLSATDTFSDVPQPIVASGSGIERVEADPPAAPVGQLALVLPLLLPIAPIAVRSARYRLGRRDPGRRLSA